MGLETENSKPYIKWRHENDAPKTCDCATFLRFGENLLDRKKWQRNKRKNEPDVEIQKQISEIKMPRFGSVYLGPFSRATKDIVEHDVKRNDNHFLVEETRNKKLKELQQE